MKKEGYDLHYSEGRFWRKVKKVGGVAGKKVIHTALLLYYVLQREDVPAWVKTAVVGALGYFIFPLDLIPDIAPLLGFSDDLSMLAATAWAVAKHIDKDVQQRATSKLMEWFPEDGTQ